MKIIKTIAELRKTAIFHRYAADNGNTGFVPTMGALHEGHLTLVRKAKEQCETVFVSIFINPVQFNNKEDLAKYPIKTEEDIKLLEKEGVDYLFLPERKEVFPEDEPEIIIDYPELTSRLCGAKRPGHFSGVLLIVHNLLNWVQPTCAYFGLKDYQQFILIKKMVFDLSFDTTITGVPLVRDYDRLALSSRNLRLSPDERQRALLIPESLKKVEDKFLSNPGIKARELKAILHQTLSPLTVDYASLYNPETLIEIDDQSTVTNALVAIAAFSGKIRLIDNLLLQK